MAKLPEHVLIECLDALDRGEPIGAILSRYPEKANELRPILETAAQLGAMNLQPTVAAQAKSKQVFLTQADGLKAGTIRRPRRRPLSVLGALLRPLLITTLLVILFLGFVTTSRNALPGDALYGAKLIIEGAQLSLSGNSASMTERIRQNRILEIEALLQQNREANVAFRGLIDEVMDETWRIEGLLVAVAAAELRGDPQMGDFVEVRGLVTNGRLIASRIVVIDKNENPPTPTPMHTPTPTEEPTRLPAQEPSFTPEPTPTVSVTPTNTSTPIPTVTLTIAPTQTAVTTSNSTSTPDDDEPDDEPDDDNSGSGSDDEPDDDEGDNSGSGSSNSGSGSSNSGSGSSNSGSGSDDEPDDDESDNSGSGSSNSGSGSSNSGSGSDDDEPDDDESDNSGSGSSNSGSGSDDDDD